MTGQSLLGWAEKEGLTQSARHLNRYTWFRAYHLGYRKPNYPLPAIPTVVDIEPNYVVLFQWIGPEMTGEYIRETILS